MARELLEHILETFPQADPASEFYNEDINGCEAVNFLSEFIPEVRKSLDDNQLNESKAIEVLKTCWDFIENVTDDDPERTGKFFALRERVRNIFAKHPQGPATVAVILEGGLVQCIVADHPDTIPPMNVMVLDYDTEGADEEELLMVPQRDGSIATATGRYVGFGQADIGLTEVMEQLDARGW